MMAAPRTRRHEAQAHRSIRRAILARLEKLLEERHLLVLYDPTHRHLLRDIAQEAGGMFVTHADAGTDPIGARKAAGEALRRLDESSCRTILYVPHAEPQSCAEKVQDPWFAGALMGARFPETPSDACEAVALRLYPEKENEIRQLFRTSRDGEPDLDEIDRIGNARGSWPLLEGESGAESRRELLRWLLVAGLDDSRFRKLRREAVRFLSDVLGTPKAEDAFPDAAGLQAVAWERALATAFLSGFGDDVPDALSTLPVAPQVNAGLVLDVLRELRDSREHGATYCRRADEMEGRLHLDLLLPPGAFPVQADDVFRIAERRRLIGVLNRTRSGDTAAARRMLPKAGCVWTTDDGPASEWAAARRAIDCVEASSQAVAALEKAASSLGGLVRAYAQDGWRLDASMRLLEESLEALDARSPGRNPDDGIGEAFAALRSELRRRHRAQCARVQAHFTRLLQSEGWPAPGIADNAGTFDAFVAPRLARQDEAVVLLVVDGLRLELGQALLEALPKDLPAELTAACARLPSVTSVGKASLLPGGSALEVRVDAAANTITPVLRGRELPGLDDRMRFLRSLYGDRFQEMTTADFLSGRRRLNDTTALLVLRSDGIDETLENNRPGLLGSLNGKLGELVRAVGKAARTSRVRFSEVVVATDHGFVLNYAPSESDRCARPGGAWAETHGRMVLGDDVRPEPNSLRLPAAMLGIRTNAALAAMPAGLCTLAAGQYYFHGGASLEEAVVPVIRVRLAADAPAAAPAAGRIELRPKKPRYRTLLPRVLVRDPAGTPGARQVRILVTRADDPERRPAGSLIDNDAGIVTLDGAETVDLRIRIDEFEEPVLTLAVLALDPASNVTLGGTTLEVELMQ